MGKLTSCAVILTAYACGGGDKKSPDAAPTADAPSETLGPAPALAMPCTDAVTDVYNLPSGLPAMSDAHRGDVFHCAVTESLSAYKVNQQIAAYDVGYTVPPATEMSGFWTYRVAYRSERNTRNNARAEGDMVAVVLVPEKPLAGAPLIVYGHGSVGVAPKCAPSHLSLAGPVDDQDYPSPLYRIAGAGYTVIMPDYSGFSYGQAPGYFDAQDEAHGLLDATRAAAQLLPNAPTKIAFIGHSQGGHAVLSAQAFAESYGHAGTIVGVAAFAPLWTSLDLFTAATTTTAGLSTGSADDLSAILYAMEYAYSESELGSDAAGHGVDVFATGKQQAAKDAILGGECYDMTRLQALGATPGDFFDSSYVNNAGNCALGGGCGDSTSTLWMSRWLADRPALDPTGAPLLIYFGGMDTFIIPGRQGCAVKKITQDLAGSGATTTVQYCNDPAATHRDLVRRPDVDTVLQWVASKAGIGAAPTCTPPSPHTCPPIPADY